jgi:hypothetical protein
MKVDTYPDGVDTANQEESVAEIPFGVFVKKGTADKSVKLMSSANDVIAGITIHSHAAQVGTGGGLAPKAAVNLGTRCRVLMTADVAVTPADPVFARYANNAGNTLTGRGTVTKTADSASAKRVYGARFMTTAAAGALVEVEFSKITYDACVAVLADATA